MTMAEEGPPSLVSLCIDAVTQQLLRTEHDDLLLPLLTAIYDLPSHLLHSFIPRLPPFALHQFHLHMPFPLIHEIEDQAFSLQHSTNARKRYRDCILNSAWRRLFELRWPDRVKLVPVQTEWQQVYWETHLQVCLDHAAELALIPSFCGCIADIQISDSILKSIGFVGNTNHSTSDRSKLSYHCLQFGSHVSCLRLQNVLCTAETSGMLRKCKLQSLVLRCIRSREQIFGLCKLLTQQCRTLTSLEFVHCKLPADFIEAIFSSLVIENVKKHGIQHLSIIASSFLEPCSVSLPDGLVSFLSSGRSFCSLKLSDNHHGRNFAKALFTTLLSLSSGISVLDLSENRIAGWLSDFNRRFSSASDLSIGIGKFLLQLRVLNLRGNNLRKDDAESLGHALVHMPNLEELDLSDNLIEDEGIKYLTPYFVGACKTCPHLTCLKFENCDLSIVGVCHLLSVLSTFEGPLKSLSVADNYLGSQVAVALGNFFSTPIEVLDVAGIGLGSNGFRELQYHIKEELKLVKINISKNRGGIETAKFLAKLLSQAPQLIDVNAASNLMTIESLPIICSALKLAKGNVQHLDLTGHTWNYKPEHLSLSNEFVHNGLPILVLPLSSASAVVYDDDP